MPDEPGRGVGFSHKMSVEQIRAFLEASNEAELQGRNRDEVYGWVKQTLRQQGYRSIFICVPLVSAIMHKQARRSCWLDVKSLGFGIL